jgi:hypothetical protein
MAAASRGRSPVWGAGPRRVSHAALGDGNVLTELRLLLDQHASFGLGMRTTGEIGPVSTTAPRHRMPVRQAAAIWTVVFLIGLTGGELLRQQTLDDPTLASTTGPTEPTAATRAPAANAVAPSATSTSTTTPTPPATTTTIGCDPSPCPDRPRIHESRTEDGKERGHGKGGKERGQGTDGKPGAGRR